MKIGQIVTTTRERRRFGNRRSWGRLKWEHATSSAPPTGGLCAPLTRGARAAPMLTTRDSHSVDFRERYPVQFKISASVLFF